MTVDFAFSDEQLALRDLARELFERESPPSRLRQLWESDEPRDDKVWRTIAEAGLLGILVPEEYGGLGGDDVDLALVLEEVGRSALPEPFIETAALAAPLLARFGSDELRETWLPRIAAGEALISVGRRAIDADVADLVIVSNEGNLHAVPRDRVRATRVGSQDRARRVFVVEADLDDSTRVSGDAGELRLRGAVATSGVLNGIATKLIELTLEHVKSRKQFDRAVGSFQAVKHKLASVHVTAESARASAWFAAFELAQGAPDRELSASIAKANASEAEHAANIEALQLHGGIGFTWEHDLHFWLKRGLALEPLYGSAAEHRGKLGRSLVE